ncbi:MAG: hypothetical protein QOH08_1337 [Chloroflexota bacterium]|jgi:hypothetical protein|nr:hypothetical protein [Chloroflexota bacterium]
MRIEAAHDTAILSVASRYAATPFNVNFADPDGQPLASCLRDILLRAGWSQLSAMSPAPGFPRRGVILWAPPTKIHLVNALAAPLRELFAVQIVERDDGGPVALTVGLATWATSRGLLPDSA